MKIHLPVEKSPPVGLSVGVILADGSHAVAKLVHKADEGGGFIGIYFVPASDQIHAGTLRVVGWYHLPSQVLVHAKLFLPKLAAAAAVPAAPEPVPGAVWEAEPSDASDAHAISGETEALPADVPAEAIAFAAP